MSCAVCGAKRFYTIRRVEIPDTPVMPATTEECENMLVTQRQCVRCSEWQDEDLPEGWGTLAAHALIYRKDGSGLSWSKRYVKTYNFKTTSREYNHSRSLVIEELRNRGYGPEDFVISVKHTPWLKCRGFRREYKVLNGWRMEKQKAEKEKQNMGQKVTVKRPEPEECFQAGRLYEHDGYIVMCTLPLAHSYNFEGVVIWSEPHKKWNTGKVFPRCSKSDYKLFEGEVTIGQP